MGTYKDVYGSNIFIPFGDINVNSGGFIQICDECVKVSYYDGSEEIWCNFSDKTKQQILDDWQEYQNTHE